MQSITATGQCHIHEVSLKFTGDPDVTTVTNMVTVELEAVMDCPVGDRSCVDHWAVTAETVVD